MTYRPRRACLGCGLDRDVVGGLSRTGKCEGCSAEALASALRQLAERRGPVWERYRAGVTDYAARLWGETVPDYPPAPHISAGSGHDLSGPMLVEDQARVPS